MNQSTLHIKDSASARIKKAILQRISDGTYAPGHRLVELQIAKEFDTSQAPIREALCELEAMRIVESVPHRGTRVREISTTELQECIELRGVIEQFAASKVADRLKSDSIFRQKAMDTVAAAREHNSRKYGMANLEFHRIIVEAAQNPTLMMAWEALAPEVRMLSNMHAMVEHLARCADEHLEIVEAFADGDNRSAGILLRKHTETILYLTKSQEN